jgi:SAM-dependent methyltransferase
MCSYLAAMSRTPAPPASGGRPDGVGGAEAERCEWCGAELGPEAERLPGRTRCRRCGAATTDPVPGDDELERAYAGWYRPGSGRFAGPGDRMLRRSRSQLARRLDEIAPAGPVLDVGAGDGTLLDALQRRGREAVGLEREPTRADVRAAEVADVDGTWAAIVFWHSLEHLRGAGKALEDAMRILGPAGVLVVAMPNADSIQARVFGDRWLALDLPRHLVHVPAPALLQALRKGGLRIERISHVRGGQAAFGWLQGLVGSLPGRPDLYDAIRRKQARRLPMSAGRRAAALAAAALLLPVAVTCAAVEAALGRGGSVYVEARRD